MIGSRGVRLRWDLVMMVPIMLRCRKKVVVQRRISRVWRGWRGVVEAVGVLRVVGQRRCVGRACWAVVGVGVVVGTEGGIVG